MAETALPPVLTLWRPWPALVLHWGKSPENRGWRTSYRGPLLIHASKAFDGDAFWFCLERVGLHPTNDMSWDGDDHPTGIVGVVELVGVCRAETVDTEPIPGWRCDGCTVTAWSVWGQHHWHLAKPRPFAEPISCRGRQGLWRVPERIAPKVRQALAAVADGE